MLLVTAVGILAFIAMLVLGAYAPDLRSGKNGGSHALSNAATGYSGLVRLAEATGRHPQIVRADHQLDSEALAILTPEAAAVDMSEVLQQRAGKATLVVLPKWETERDKRNPGWVRVAGPLPVYEPAGVLAPGTELKVSRVKGSRRPLVTVPGHASGIHFAEPLFIQAIAGAKLNPIITDRDGRILLGQIEQSPLYVLADPDLLNNHGMADPGQAAAALALLDFLNSTGSTEILFDVTLNGLGGSRSPLKLAFDPPFLAVTLAIFAALLLAGLQGLTRFGAPLRPARAIAFGKGALVDNSAALIRKAGREASLGARYADMIRERAAGLLRLPPSLPPDKAEERLNALVPARPFAELAAAAEQARHRDTLLATAQKLHHWLKEAKA